MNLELVLTLLALAIALGLRPWRQLRGGALASPFLGVLVVLPWLWALPRLHAMPLQLQLSGACAVTLMLGWPLAIPTLCAVGFLAQWFAPAPFDAVITQTFWLGIVPSSLALAVGAALRHWTGTHPFIYILGRAFAGTVLCTFAAEVFARIVGHPLVHIESSLAMVAYWLIAWGDGFMTGLLAAIFVAFRHEWLATWSDKLYLQKPPQ